MMLTSSKNMLVSIWHTGAYCPMATFKGQATAVSTREIIPEVFIPFSRQQPMRVCIGHLDESKDGVGGDGAAPFVIMPCPEGEVQRFGKQRSSMLTVKFLADHANSSGQVLFDGMPV